GSMSAISSNIFKPVIDGKESLTDIDKKLKSAREALNAAQTRNAAATTAAGSASSIAAIEKAESKVNELMKVRSEIAEQLPNEADNFLKKNEEIKETWEGLWTPHANRVLRDANKGMSIGIRLMERYGYFTGRSADLFSQIVEAAERLSG